MKRVVPGIKILAMRLAVISLPLAALVACGSGSRKPTPPAAAERPSLASFLDAASILPPSALAIAWADVDALRDGPASPLLEGIDRSLEVPGTSQTTFIGDNLGSIHRIAGGMYPTMSGTSILVILDGDFTPETMFEAARTWAGEREVAISPCKVRGRAGLRSGGTVLVHAGEGMFVNGPEGLVTRSLDLMDRKVTGSVVDPELAYLASSTVEEPAALVVSGITPPTSYEWLLAKKLPSMVGSRFLLSASTPGDIRFRLGLLAGKPIKPIWFAQEVNTFLVRASDDPGIVKLGLSDWVEGLEVELLAKGIVVKGAIDPDKLVEVVKGPGGES